MSFNFDFFEKVSASMSLDKTYNSSSGVVGARVPTMYMYNASATGSNDSSAVVLAANYFLKAYAYLGVGDIIYVSTSDPAFQIRAVATSASGGVTVAALT